MYDVDEDKYRSISLWDKCSHEHFPKLANAGAVVVLVLVVLVVAAPKSSPECALFKDGTLGPNKEVSPAHVEARR
eukprot:926996-Amphidinium_carterae.1